jgi:putative phage-type endonuclease
MARYNYKISQRSPEWLAARLGRFTASDFHTFLGDSKTKGDMLWEKVAERLFHDSDDNGFTTFAMERGTILEAEARRVYTIATGDKVKEVGIVLPDDDDKYAEWIASSPDGLVGKDGMIEIKCPLAKNFLQWTTPTDSGREVSYIKPEYKTQVQFNLMVTGRDWCDFLYYHPRGGVAISRIYHDDDYIERIKTALDGCIEFVKQQIGDTDGL